jgi:hypothetical protein
MARGKKIKKMMHIYTMQLHLSQKLPEAGNERLSRQWVWVNWLRPYACFSKLLTLGEIETVLNGLAAGVAPINAHCGSSAV